MPSPVKVGAAFFCEDVRTEATGKFMFIGTYTGRMVSGINPANLYVNLVVIVKAEHAATARMQLVVHHGEKKLADADFTVVVDETGNEFCIFPPLLLDDVTESMPITVDAQLDDDPRERIFTAVFEVPEAEPEDADFYD